MKGKRKIIYSKSNNIECTLDEWDMAMTNLLEGDRHRIANEAAHGCEISTLGDFVIVRTKGGRGYWINSKEWDYLEDKFNNWEMAETEEIEIQE